jgi:hypothetical protein
MTTPDMEDRETLGMVKPLDGPVKGFGFEPNGGGFSHILVGERKFTAEQVRAALTIPDAKPAQSSEAAAMVAAGLFSNVEEANREIAMSEFMASPANQSTIRELEETLSPEDLQLLMRLKDDNISGGARPVLESNFAKWDQAMRLSDAGLLAIEQIALGGVLHITRKGVAAVRSALHPQGPGEGK